MHSRPDEQLVLVDPSEPAESALKLLQSIKPTGSACSKIYLPIMPYGIWPALIPGLFAGYISTPITKGKRFTTIFCSPMNSFSPTGIICVDDFMSPRYPQITFTVCTFVELFCRELRMFLCGFNKAYLVRPESLFTHLTFVKTSSETNKAFLGSIILPFIKQTIRILLTASASRLAGKITSTLDSMKIRRKFQFERNESHLLA
jgi:hypothetical protein